MVTASGTAVIIESYVSFGRYRPVCHRFKREAAPTGVDAGDMRWPRTNYG